MNNRTPAKVRSKKAEWAWEHAAAVYEERDLLVRALSLLYPSHLMRHHSARNLKPVVCIHTPAGQLAWTLMGGDDEARARYRHLEWRDNDWDGHKTSDRIERLTALHAAK